MHAPKSNARHGTNLRKPERGLEGATYTQTVYSLRSPQRRAKNSGDPRLTRDRPSAIVLDRRVSQPSHPS